MWRGKSSLASIIFKDKIRCSDIYLDRRKLLACADLHRILGIDFPAPRENSPAPLESSRERDEYLVDKRVT